MCLSVEEMLDCLTACTVKEVEEAEDFSLLPFIPFFDVQLVKGWLNI